MVGEVGGSRCGVGSEVRAMEIRIDLEFVGNKIGHDKMIIF